MLVGGNVNAFGNKNAGSLLKNLISVGGDINIAETGLNHFPASNIEYIGGNVIISKDSSESLFNEIQKLKDNGVLKGNIIFWEPTDNSLRIGGISLSKVEDPRILLAFVSDTSQEEFDDSLGKLLQWLPVLTIKKIVFQTESNLILPAWFIQQCRQIELAVQAVQEEFDQRIQKMMDANTPQGIKFLDWLQEKYPDRDILGNESVSEIKGLVAEFCEAHSYRNFLTFSKEVVGWLDGSGSKNIIEKLIEISRQIKTKNQTYNPKVSSFKRYKTIQYHAIFLFLCVDDFPSFIKKWRSDLNSITGDFLDIYYSREDLERSYSDDTPDDGLTSFINGTAIANEFSSIDFKGIQLPALVLWQNSLKDAFVVSIDKITERDIHKLIKSIVEGIKANQSFSQICGSAKDFVKSETNSSAATQNIQYYIEKIEETPIQG